MLLTPPARIALAACALLVLLIPAPALAQTAGHITPENLPPATCPANGSELAVGDQNGVTVKFTASALPFCNDTATSLPLAGGTMTGPLTLFTPSSSGPALICPPGSAPGSPGNGAVWCTSSGFFYELGGVSHQLATLSATLQAANNLSDLANPVSALNAISGLRHVANNTAMSALAHTTYPIVVRDGFAAFGDAPPLTFVPSASACSMASGAGDGAVEVHTSDGGCWNAVLPSEGMDWREWGVVCDGSTDNSVAMQLAANVMAGVTTGSPVNRGTLIDGDHPLPCKFSTTLAVPKYLRMQGPYQGTLTGLTAGFTYTGTADAFKQGSPINSSTAVNNVLEGMVIQCSNASNAGANYDDVGGTFLTITHSYLTGCKFSVILDQTEQADIDLTNLTPLLSGGGGCIWLVNDAEHTAGASAGFTNRISWRRSQCNTAGTAGVVDDGGVNHDFEDDYIDGVTSGFAVADVFGLTVKNVSIEGATGTNVTFDNQSYFGHVSSGTSLAVVIETSTFVPAASQCAIDNLHAGLTLTSIQNLMTAASGAVYICHASNVASLDTEQDYVNGQPLTSGGNPFNLIKHCAAGGCPTYIYPLQIQNVSLVSNLPTCNAAEVGVVYWVGDATSMTPYTTAAGSGSNFVGVVCNPSSNWVIF
jgi:hypothetical protein